jgi:putative ABC transport system substrate-binding protein
MRRRKFIAWLGAATTPLLAPLAVRAQQAAMPVIGFLNSATSGGYAPMLAAFRQGLKEAGYAEGENVAIEYRWADDRNDRLPAMAADLVVRKVSVIVANGPAAFAAKAATATIPIVFFGGYNPVTVGLVASLNRPGGNATGVTIMNVELGPKKLELARELVPAATDMALLVNQTNPNAMPLARDMQAAAASLKLKLHVLRASTEREVDRAFESASGLRAAALVIGPDPFFNTRSAQFAALTLRHRLPTVYQYREFAAAGGLMSYGGSITDLYRLIGVYTGRILKGEKPADLPVQQSSKVELFINLKTAKTLGLNVPLSLLGRADEVIE